MKYIYFGTDEIISIPVLDILVGAGLKPSLIVTVPDKPQGRKMIMTPPPLKEWALKNGVQFIQPEKFNDDVLSKLKQTSADIFIVVSYGKIIPKSVLDIPLHGILNVHPSLLPKYRGSSPVETAILNDDKETGVTIMKMDEQMDHGPILAQEKVSFDEWRSKSEVYEKISRIAGQKLAEILPGCLAGEIKPVEQNHSMATFTKKFEKKDGEIKLSGNDRENFLKYIAFHPWPGIFFFDEKGKRIKVTKARFETGKFIVEKVIPEGGKEADFKGL